MKDYSAIVSMPGLKAQEDPRLHDEAKVIEDAIARGQEVGRQLVSARDALFEPMRAIYRIGGRDGLMACILGVYLAVTSDTGGKR